MHDTGLTRVEHRGYSHAMTQTQQHTTTDGTWGTPREYVVRFDYGDGPHMAVCTTDRMRKSIEDSHYAGEADDARYFSFMTDRNGVERFVEVEFKCIRSDRADADDYLYSEWGVFRKDSPRGSDAKPFDRFTVRIDGRA